MDMTGAVVHSSETIIRKKKKKAKNEKIQSEEVRLQMRVFLLFGTCTEDAVDFYFNVEDEAQTKSQSKYACIIIMHCRSRGFTRMHASYKEQFQLYIRLRLLLLLLP
jgi:hypothetical protein